MVRARRAYAGAVSLLLVIGLLLRVNLGPVSLTSDEAKYLMGLDYPGHGLVTRLFAALVHIAVPHERIALLTALFDLGTGLLVFGICARIHRRLALVGLAAYVFMPASILYSHTLYLDIFVGFFWTLAMVMVLEIQVFRQRSWIRYGLLYASLLAAALIKPWAALVIFPLGLVVCLTEGWSVPRVRKNPLSWLIPASLVPFLLEYLAHPSRLADVRFYYVGGYNDIASIGPVAKAWATVGNLWEQVGGVYFFIAMGAVLLVWWSRKGAERTRQFTRAWLVAWASVSLFLLFIMASAEYYSPILSPSLAVLTGLLCCGLIARWRWWGVPLGVGIAAVHLLVFASTGSSGKTALQEHREELNRLIDGDEVVVLWTPGHHEQFFLHKTMFRSCILRHRPTIRFALEKAGAVEAACQYGEMIAKTWERVREFRDDRRRYTLYRRPG